MTFGQFALWYFYCWLITLGVAIGFKVVVKLLRSP